MRTKFHMSLVDFLLIRIVRNIGSWEEAPMESAGGLVEIDSVLCQRTMFVGLVEVGELVEEGYQALKCLEGYEFLDSWGLVFPPLPIGKISDI